MKTDNMLIHTFKKKIIRLQGNYSEFRCVEMIFLPTLRG